MRSNNTTTGLWVMLAVTSFTMPSGATQAAQPSGSSPEKSVSFKDLNLNSTEGVTVLYGRIQSAANEVCENVDQRDLARVAAARGCVAKATSRAIIAVDSPSLTSLYLAKTGKTGWQLIAQAR
jgi:UrcA family protein